MGLSIVLAIGTQRTSPLVEGTNAYYLDSGVAYFLDDGTPYYLDI
jgi:hypothetical protein